MTYKITGLAADKFAERLMYLAWCASGVYGMGAFQDRGVQDQEAVINNIVNSGDYVGGRAEPAGTLYGDYVFGRMMKTTCRFDKDTITVSDGKPRHDYQSWARKYPTYEDLVLATAVSFHDPAIMVEPA